MTSFLYLQALVNGLPVQSVTIIKSILIIYDCQVTDKSLGMIDLIPRRFIYFECFEI